MSYNLTSVENATNILDLVTASNNLTSGYFMVFFLFVINIVVLMFLKDRFDFGVIMVGVNFLSTILAIMMFLLGFIGFGILIVPLIFLFISIFIYFFSKD